MLCVIVTSGSNQLNGDVNVDINIIGGTASGDFFKFLFFTITTQRTTQTPLFASLATTSSITNGNYKGFFTDLDYTFFDRTIKIPFGAMPGQQYCASMRLSIDDDVEVREETIIFSLADPATGSSHVSLADTVKTVTIIDIDSE